MVIIKIEKRTYDNLIFKKVYFLWRNMMQRCYNENHPSYKYYGNKGVIVNERWHVFNNFIEDIDKINGFNIDKFLKGEIHLDKDLTILGNKEYSLEKCLFVTKEKIINLNLINKNSLLRYLLKEKYIHLLINQSLQKSII